MFDENERLWIHLKRLFRLFPVTFLLWLWLMMTYQDEYMGYLLHRSDYRIFEAQVFSLDMETVHSWRSGDTYLYYTTVSFLDDTKKEAILHRDINDYEGRIIKVAVNKQNPEDVRRVGWLHGKGSVRDYVRVLEIVMLLLLFGKIISHFKLKKMWCRIDKIYEREVIARREELLKLEEKDKNVLVTKVIREANDMVTLESVRIKCCLTETGEIIKSPLFYGHTILHEGDYIKLDKDIIEKEEAVQWAQYII